MKRRSIVLASTAVAVTLGGPRLALAEAYPSQSIRIIVPWPAGGAADFVARALAEGMRKDLGQAIAIDNKPGLTGRLGIAAARAAPADGYTLLLAVSNTHGVAAALDPKLPYDPIRDFTAIGVAAVGPLAVAVHPSVPAKTLPELVAYAKGKPGRLYFASAGPGSASHLMGEMLKATAGINIVHVPYKGTAQAMQDVVAGQVQVIINSAVKTYVAEGRLRALATTGSQRWSALPDVPTTAEAGFPALQSASWFGLMGPKGLPQPVVERLNHALLAALKEPALQAALKNQGLDIAAATSPAGMKSFISSEIERWKKNLRRINYTHLTE